MADRQQYVQEALDAGYTAEAAEKIADERLEYDSLVADGLSEEEASELVWGSKERPTKPAEPTAPTSAPGAPPPSATPQPDPATPFTEGDLAEDEPDGVLVLDASVNVLVKDPASETGHRMVEYPFGTLVKDTVLSAEQIDELTAQRHIVLKPSGAK
jgi:hypothetical protein